MGNSNQRSASPGQAISEDTGLPDYPFFNAVIEDIIINDENPSPLDTLTYRADGSNIGEARFRVIPYDRGVPVEKLRTAFPLESNIQEYPLLGEGVLVYKTFGGYYYTRPLAYLRRITQNNMFFIKNTFSESSVSGKDEKMDARELASRGALTERTEMFSSQNYNLGKYIINRDIFNSNSIRPCEGDVLIQGRFGNAIRIGSSLMRKSVIGEINPNIILTAGLWKTPEEVSCTTQNGAPTPHSLQYENINEDKSSIWMVSDQKVDFLPATAVTPSDYKCHLLSSENLTTDYSGAQIFINSDRVVINSKLNQIQLFAKTEINLSALKAITLNSESSIYLRSFRDINIQADDTITLSAKNIAFTSLQDLAYSTAGNYSITGKRIFIGKHGDIQQPMVLGAELASWLKKFIESLTNGGIITATGPATLNPTVMLPLITALGLTPQLASFNSRANFTSEQNSV